ncbi:unnamed protein product [Brachionus calyciflorus]|uniref:Uncharacterized protein n=1 Tax=Brachionus calyciflorus TaxID=104777 RepID=A0A813YHG9_9BILA|nr:unnamed protein product [Brachionus calyciflorus]
MKSQIDDRHNQNLSTHLTNGTSGISNGSNGLTHNNNIIINHVNIQPLQRKSSIHDLTQTLIEECQKLMTECHKSLSKYHNCLLSLSNGSLNETLNKDELKGLRSQNYKFIKSSLEALIPKIDQVNFNDKELFCCIQQIIAYLEYLKFEFVRHFYILKSFAMQNDHVAGQMIIRCEETKQFEIVPFMDLNKKTELYEIQQDINEIDQVIHKLSQKYYIFVPDLDDIKTWNKKGLVEFSDGGSYNFLSKFKYICCFCSPKYI